MDTDDTQLTRDETPEGSPESSERNTRNAAGSSSLGGRGGSNSAAVHSMRTRITVVCAECKRLKLRCDRRSPCGSCQKRCTIARCIYSTEAIQKIDLQSLHNRILVLEEEKEAAALSSGPSRQRSSSLYVAPTYTYPSLATDPGLIAIQNNSSTVVPTDGIAGLWLDELGINSDTVFLDPSGFQSIKQESGAEPGLDASTVAPHLIAELPSVSVLAVLDQVLALHPVFNVRDLRQRIGGLSPYAMSSAASMDVHHASGSSGAAPPATSHRRNPPPTMSMYALACASFALALLASPRSAQSHDPEIFIQRAESAMASCANNGTAHNLDYIGAWSMLVRCALYRKTRGGLGLGSEIGTVLYVARTMGLDRDPDDWEGESSGPKWSLWEKEMRKRAWWDLVYHDMFLAERNGHPPLIPEGSFTTSLPVGDLDEATFMPGSTFLPVVRLRATMSSNEDDLDGWHPTVFKYFVLRCQLAQLVKSVQSRIIRDPAPDSATPHQYTIDQATQLADEIRAFFDRLPAAYRLSMHNPSASNTSSFPSETATQLLPSILIAQQCGLVVPAQRLIIKVYLPFLRTLKAHGSPLLQASLATVNAAHVIVQASRTLYRHSVVTSLPASHYSFQRSLFDAAAVCAHGVIRQPTSLWAEKAMDDVQHALDILRDPNVCGDIIEAVNVIDVLKHRGQRALSGKDTTTGGDSNAQHKRKVDDVEKEELDVLVEKHWKLPFIGAPAVVTTGMKSHSRASDLSEVREMPQTPTYVVNQAEGPPMGTVSTPTSEAHPSLEPHTKTQQKKKPSKLVARTRAIATNGRVGGRSNSDSGSSRSTSLTHRQQQQTATTSGTHSPSTTIAPHTPTEYDPIYPSQTYPASFAAPEASNTSPHQGNPYPPVLHNRPQSYGVFEDTPTYGPGDGNTRSLATSVSSDHALYSSQYSDGHPTYPPYSHIRSQQPRPPPALRHSNSSPLLTSPMSNEQYQAPQVHYSPYGGGSVPMDTGGGSISGPYHSSGLSYGGEATYEEPHMTQQQSAYGNIPQSWAPQQSQQQQPQIGPPAEFWTAQPPQ